MTYYIVFDFFHEPHIFSLNARQNALSLLEPIGIQSESAEDLKGNTVRDIRNSVTAPATVGAGMFCVCHWMDVWEGADHKKAQVRRPATGTKIHLGGVS